MNLPAFDTLQFASDLEEGGFTAQQARTAAKAFAHAATGELATKSDIANLKQETKADFAAVRSETARLESIVATKADLADAKAELMRWMFGLVGFQTVIVLGSVVALARAFH